MDAARFEATVARLEQESARTPGTYQFKVALLALLGFGVLALVLGLAGLGLLLLVGMVVAVVVTGGKAALLLLKFGKLLVLLALPLWFLVQAALKALFVRLPAPEGEEVTRAQAPALFTALDDMRRRMKGPRFHHVLIVDEVNAAAAQRPLFGLIGWPRNHLLLGLPLLEAFSPDEALAVVAHEYGHLAGSHGRFGAFIYRLRWSWAAIDDHASRWQGWAGRALQRLIGWYAPWFNAYTFVLARQNEYEADAASAELVGAGVTAQALKRTDLVAPRYHAFLGSTFERIGDDAAPPRDLAERWARTAALALPEGEAHRWLADALERQGAVHDTHPVLRARLAALPGQAGTVQDLPPLREGPSAAEAWLGAHAEVLRRAFQARWAERVAEPWRERHESLLAQRARLAELRGRAVLERDEQFELLQLRDALEPDAGSLLDDVAAFNRVHANQASGLFLEGRLRLAADDERGIDCLERVIAIDAEATLPACEQVIPFLGARKDARLDAWVERWNARARLEHDRAAQLQTLGAKPELRDAGLGADTYARARALLQAQAEGVAHAWLVRRVLPADPGYVTYLLAVELTRWASFRSRQQVIVERLAAIEWPVQVMIVALGDGHKALRKSLKALPAARLF